MQRPDKTTLHTAGLEAGQPLTAFYDAAVAAHLAVALWRQPGQAVVRGVVDLGGVIQPAAIDFQAGEPAFVFSPFYSEDGNPPLRVRADVQLCADGLRTNHALWNGQRQRYEAFFAAYQAAQTGRQPAAGQWYAPTQLHPPHCSNYVEYCGLVDKAIDFM